MRKKYKLILPYLKKYKAKLIFASILTFISPLLKLVEPLLTKRFLDYSLPKNDLKEYAFIFILILSLTILSMLTYNISDYIFKTRAKYVGFGLRGTLLTRLFQAPHKEIKKKGWGYYVSRIEEDTSQVLSFFLDQLMSVITTSIIFISSITMCIYLSYKLSIGYIIIIIISGFLVKKQNKTLIEQGREYKEKEALKTEKLGEALSMIEFSKLSGNSEYVLNKYMDATWLSVKAYIKYVTKVIIINLSSSGSVEIGLQIMTWGFGIYLMYKGELTVGSVIAISSFGQYAIGAFSTLIHYYFNYQNANVSFERIEEILNIKQEIPDKKIIKSLNIKSIEFKNVCVEIDDHLILNNISFKFEKGDKVLITGPSGIGKSTIFNVILGILPVKSGKILINNKIVEPQDLFNYRLKIGLVQQEPVLVNDTIANNIKILNKNASINIVNNAISFSNLGDVIAEKEGKIDFIVGNNGNNLSIGQKQRVAIARMIVRNPDLLLLDEPTSNVDKESIKSILDSISKVDEEKIVFMISHQDLPGNVFNKKLDFNELVN